tara:strand:+ start:1542 stop:1898 length:357 start_codon:yes stop_codon:yes gene_type:complete
LRVNHQDAEPGGGDNGSTDQIDEKGRLACVICAGIVPAGLAPDTIARIGFSRVGADMTTTAKKAPCDAKSDQYCSESAGEHMPLVDRAIFFGREKCHRDRKHQKPVEDTQWPIPNMNV